MEQKAYINLLNRFVLPTYSRLPVSLVRGHGVWLWDAGGKKYLDFFAGLAVNNLGYNHPRISAVISRQSKRIIHCSNIFYIQEQARLARKLVRLTGMHQAFFCNSGAEAIEACIKLARLWSLKRFGKRRFEIIVFENSFHGRTFGAISATAQKKYQSGFGPLLPGFKVVPYNNLAAVKKAYNRSTCAVLVEPIQGEGGVRVPDKDFLIGLRKLCNKKKILLIVDEVQVGMGRTGRFLASNHFGVKPDLLAMAKGLGSGIPIGACLAGKKVASVVRPGIHASTFGGNPFASSVALETLSIIAKPDFLKKVRGKGNYFTQKLKNLKKEFPVIREVRGMGLMIACELKKNIAPLIVKRCLEKGLLINSIQKRILRFIPPLIVERKEIDRAVHILKNVLKEA